ncbi:protoporphyrinogen oxidase HemJ [Devosia sp.]|uniref:protoporphyrinogen oxidase HemJ n=1 Tax=Devosia sp. TaxID=1871048 RepID=UPI0027367D17|nr:protoporphyrinogen oxidase HemJ [Devosia sp.]MDP2780773.1 protoporphyrinogen oxidase HemJ [Devosia sp.]
MEWVKAAHVLSVIAWMAGLLYLPRLFIYHAGVAVGSEASETFKTMERKLYRGITTPAMIASWIFGLWLAFGYGLVDFSQGWMWVKALTVIVLTGVQGFYGSLRRAFAEDRNRRSHKFFRAINEIPFVLAIIIVIMVIVKPF